MERVLDLILLPFKQPGKEEALEERQHRIVLSSRVTSKVFLAGLRVVQATHCMNHLTGHRLAYQAYKERRELVLQSALGERCY